MPKRLKVSAENAELPNAPEDVISPPGMLMRSGRKKRRRSRENSGLSTEGIAKKKRSGVTEDEVRDKKEGMETEAQDDDDDLLDDQGDEEIDGDDESEEEDEQIDYEPLQWMPTDTAVAAIPTAPSAAVADSVSGDVATKIAPVKNLRLLSEQTPAKRIVTAKPTDTPYDHRYLGRIAIEEIQQVKESPVVSQVTDFVGESQNIPESDDLRVDSPVRRLLSTIRSKIKDIIVPGTPDLELDDDEDVADHASLVFRPHFWFVVIVVLQGLYFQYYLNPVLTTMYEFSGHSVLWYKNLIGVQPTLIEKITEVEVVLPIPSPIKKVTKVVEKVIHETPVDNKEVTELFNDLVDAKTELVKNTVAMEKAHDEINKELDLVMMSLAEKEASLKAWDAALSKAEEEIVDLLKASPSDIPSVIKDREIVQSLERLEQASLMDLNAEIVTADLPMWDVLSSDDCTQPQVNDSDPFVTDAHVLDGGETLKEAANNAIQEVMQDPQAEESIRAWVNEELEGADLNVDITIPEIETEVVDDDIDLPIGVTDDDAKKIISERLDSHISDSIGLLDLVARYNGAEVIHKGARATTPSLVQSLPFLNRLMAAAKLRFYGHGPNAALSPTIPADALGQCWSFEDISKSKNPRWKNRHKRDVANGRYASLSVKLAKATTIKRIVIEHNAPPEKSESSAIKDFRLFGYTDSKAIGNPIDLGAFQFEKDGPPTQQFRISKEHDMLRSITMAIDSAHSQDFACLYRVRILEN